MMNVVAVAGRSTRDAAILKMNADQIVEARKRAAAFVPHQMQKSEMPEPSWVKQIKLNGISGTGEHRLAIINNHTFQKGDAGQIKAAGKTVMIHCIEVKESSVLVAVEGLDGQRELKMASQ